MVLQHLLFRGEVRSISVWPLVLSWREWQRSTRRWFLRWNSLLTCYETYYPLPKKYVKQAEASIENSFALTVDGEVYSWDSGTSINSWLGLLEDGTTTQRNRPVRILKAMPQVVDSCVGLTFVLALTSDNAVYVWGMNENSPTILLSSSSSYNGGWIVGLECGSQHALLLVSTGKVYGWGGNWIHQVGDSRLYGTTVSIPVEQQSYVALGEALANIFFIQVSAGEAFSMGLTDQGEVHVWGDNSRGQVASDGVSSNPCQMCRWSTEKIVSQENCSRKANSLCNCRRWILVCMGWQFIRSTRNQLNNSNVNNTCESHWNSKHHSSFSKCLLLMMRWIRIQIIVECVIVQDNVVLCR